MAKNTTHHEVLPEKQIIININKIRNGIRDAQVNMLLF